MLFTQVQKRRHCYKLRNSKEQMVYLSIYLHTLVQVQKKHVIPRTKSEDQPRKMTGNSIGQTFNLGNYNRDNYSI